MTLTSLKISEVKIAIPTHNIGLLNQDSLSILTTIHP